MGNYSKFVDVNAILNRAESDLNKIEKKYNNSLHAQKVSEDLLIDIKNYLGHLRSAIDYLNNKIPNADGNFPITDHQNDFAKRYLVAAPNIRSIVEKWQPYNNNSWFQWFNILNNKNKHITLVPQQRKEIVQTRVTGPGGGSVSWGSGVTFGSGVSVMGIPIDPNTQLPVPNEIVKTERITWVHFLFDNSDFPQLPGDISALPFLKLSFQNITKIISEIEALIP